MHCEHVLFAVFLVIYTITGVALAIVAVVANHNNQIQDTISINRPIRYYMIGASSCILVTCAVFLIAHAFYSKKLIVIRGAVVLLTLGIFIEITWTAITVLVYLGKHPNFRQHNMIITCSLTGYLIVLQIYGIIASLSYHAELRHNYHELPSK